MLARLDGFDGGVYGDGDADKYQGGCGREKSREWRE